MSDITTQSIELSNGTTVCIARDGNLVRGIADVTAGGISLRSTREYVCPQFATSNGLEATAFEFVEMRTEGDTHIIVTRPHFRPAHRMEWMEHGMHARMSTASWSHETVVDDARLEWVIRPARRTFSGREYVGFSYAYRYRGSGMDLYQIEDKASWELGGDARGNTFVMRGHFAPPIVEIADDTAYRSGWTMPGIPNPYIFQHLPLYAQLQGFTFQYDDAHALVTVHERPSHVRSLFEHAPGSPALLHFNQYCFDLTDEIETPAHEVLLAARDGTSRTSVMNHFLRVRDEIQASIRDHYGLRFDTARPTCHVETWDIAKRENFAAIFDRLHEWGFKRTFLMPLWRSSETDVVPRFAEGKEHFGVLGNMCCPIELEIAECYGGWDGLRDILSKAVEHGIETYMWFGSHFSSVAPERISRFFARDQAGQWQRNNYGHVLCAVDQTDPEYQEYLVSSYKHAKECGLTGVFRDSHWNMAADTIVYRHTNATSSRGGATADQVGFVENAQSPDVPVVRSMHDAEAAIQRRFQNELGMLYYVESAGVLGTPMCGVDYDWIRGSEFIFADMDTGLNPEKAAAHGDSPERAYFRALSARLFYQVNVEVNGFPEPDSISPWWNAETMAPMVKAFAEVEPFMKQLWVLDDGTGVRWTDGTNQVVFAYEAFSHTLDEAASCREVLSGRDLGVVTTFDAEPLRIYVVTPRKTGEDA